MGDPPWVCCLGVGPALVPVSFANSSDVGFVCWCGRFLDFGPSKGRHDGFWGVGVGEVDRLGDGVGRPGGAIGDGAGKWWLVGVVARWGDGLGFCAAQDPGISTQGGVQIAHEFFPEEGDKVIRGAHVTVNFTDQLVDFVKALDHAFLVRAAQ